jgi:hypothetical protein
MATRRPHGLIDPESVRHNHQVSSGCFGPSSAIVIGPADNNQDGQVLRSCVSDHPADNLPSEGGGIQATFPGDHPINPLKESVQVHQVGHEFISRGQRATEGHNATTRPTRGTPARSIADINSRPIEVVLG